MKSILDLYTENYELEKEAAGLADIGKRLFHGPTIKAKSPVIQGWKKLKRWKAGAKAPVDPDMSAGKLTEVYSKGGPELASFQAKQTVSREALKQSIADKARRSKLLGGRGATGATLERQLAQQTKEGKGLPLSRASKPGVPSGPTQKVQEFVDVGPGLRQQGFSPKTMTEVSRRSVGGTQVSPKPAITAGEVEIGAAFGRNAQLARKKAENQLAATLGQETLTADQAAYFKSVPTKGMQRIAQKAQGTKFRGVREITTAPTGRAAQKIGRKGFKLAEEAQGKQLLSPGGGKAAPQLPSIAQKSQVVKDQALLEELAKRNPSLKVGKGKGKGKARIDPTQGMSKSQKAAYKEERKLKQTLKKRIATPAEGHGKMMKEVAETQKDVAARERLGLSEKQLKRVRTPQKDLKQELKARESRKIRSYSQPWNKQTKQGITVQQLEAEVKNPNSPLMRAVKEQGPDAPAWKAIWANPDPKIKDYLRELTHGTAGTAKQWKGPTLAPGSTSKYEMSMPMLQRQHRTMRNVTNPSAAAGRYEAGAAIPLGAAPGTTQVPPTALQRGLGTVGNVAKGFGYAGLGIGGLGLLS